MSEDWKSKHAAFIVRYKEQFFRYLLSAAHCFCHERDRYGNVDLRKTFVCAGFHQGRVKTVKHLSKDPESEAKQNEGDLSSLIEKLHQKQADQDDEEYRKIMDKAQTLVDREKENIADQVANDAFGSLLDKMQPVAPVAQPIQTMAQSS